MMRTFKLLRTYKPRVCRKCNKEYVPTNSVQKDCIDCMPEYDRRKSLLKKEKTDYLLSLSPDQLIAHVESLPDEAY